MNYGHVHDESKMGISLMTVLKDAEFKAMHRTVLGLLAKIGMAKETGT